MCAGRVACCTVVSHGKYVLTGQTDRRTDRRHIVTLRFLLDAASEIRFLAQRRCMQCVQAVVRGGAFAANNQT